jgi:hypothetical protein
MAMSAPIHAQASWTQIKTGTVTGTIANHTAVWANHLGKAVMFGGETTGTNGAMSQETYQWDGSNWAKMAPKTKPGKRNGHAMAADWLNKGVFMFGGTIANSTAGKTGDTWRWDGSDWTQLKPTTSPSARDWCSMAFHLRSQKCVLFGGRSTTAARLADTWLLDGKTGTWSKASPKTSPSARWYYNMVTGHGGDLYLFGGQVTGTRVNDLWKWDGTDWSPITPSTKAIPEARAYAAMWYDQDNDILVLHGGRGNGKDFHDTWEFHFATMEWVQRTETKTQFESHTAYFFDPIRKVGILHGGGRASGKAKAYTWAYKSNPASVSPVGSGCKGNSTNGVPVLSASLPWLGQTFTAQMSNLVKNNKAMLIIGVKLSNPAVSLAPMGADGCNLYLDLQAGAIFLPMVNTTGIGSFAVAVPNTPALAGATAPLQAYAADNSANPMGIVVSNAVTIVAGVK